MKFYLYKELYKELLENTIAEKIIRLRLMKHLEREELSKLLNFHLDTVQHWEMNDIMPKPENILKLCNFFNVPLEYFHEYYKIYFDNSSKRIRVWKDKNFYSYPDAMKLLNISHSGFAILLSVKISLSFEMYLKLNGLGTFN